jgi:RNA polymerase sigma factor (sigma-70 family)
MGNSILASARDSDSATIGDSLERPERFAAIFDRHHLAVHRYLARRLPRAQADDLASLTFVVAFERRRSFQPQSTSARPWLLGIATNLLHERHRLERREHGALALLTAEQPPAPTGFSAEGGCDEADSDGLVRALAELDPGQRDVLLLYAWEELSYEEIAEALAIPLGTVRSRLARARAHLKTRLDQPPNPDPIHARSDDD